MSAAGMVGRAGIEGGSDGAAGHARKLRCVVGDVVQTVLIPLVCYRIAREVFGVSEVAALLWSSVYPVARACVQLWRDRRLSPANVLVVLGILLSAVVLWVGGSPRVLLIRESLLTLAVGLVCFVSLAWCRPLMFYFGREMWAGSDREKRERFEQASTQEPWRGVHRRITAVWGAVLTAEFCVKAAVVWWCSTAVAMGVGSVLFYAVMGGTMAWTMRYVGHMRRAEGV